MRKIIFIAVFAMFLSSCYYDNLSELHPEIGLAEDCDSTTVTYNQDIKPLFVQYCGSGNSNCHSQDNPAQNPSLETFDDVSFLVLNGGPQLLSSITHDDPSNVSPMPKDGGKLSDCKINKVKAWINQGLIE